MHTQGGGDGVGRGRGMGHGGLSGSQGPGATKKTHFYGRGRRGQGSANAGGGWKRRLDSQAAWGQPPGASSVPQLGRESSSVRCACRRRGDGRRQVRVPNVVALEHACTGIAAHTCSQTTCNVPLVQYMRYEDVMFPEQALE